eukprot:jgi/Ulvmu1/702/UM010_0074.1
MLPHAVHEAPAASAAPETPAAPSPPPQHVPALSRSRLAPAATAAGAAPNRGAAGQDAGSHALADVAAAFHEEPSKPVASCDAAAAAHNTNARRSTQSPAQKSAAGDVAAYREGHAAPSERAQHDALAGDSPVNAVRVTGAWGDGSGDLDDEVWATAVSAVLPDNPEEGDSSNLLAAARDAPASTPIAATAAAATGLSGGASAAAAAPGSAAPAGGAAAARDATAPPPLPRISTTVSRPVSGDTVSMPLPVSHAAAAGSMAASAPSEPASTTPSAALDCFMREPCPDASPTPSYAAVTPPSTTVSDSSVAFPAWPPPRNAAVAAQAAATPPTPRSPDSDSSATGAEVSFVYAAFPDLRSTEPRHGPASDASMTRPSLASAQSGVAPTPTSAPELRTPALSPSLSTTVSPTRRTGRPRLLSRNNPTSSTSSTFRRSAQEVFGALRRTFSRRRSTDTRAAPLPVVEPTPAPAPHPPTSPRSKFFRDVHNSIFSLGNVGSSAAPPPPHERPREGSSPSHATSATSVQGLMPPSPGALLSPQLSMSNSEALMHCGSDASAPAAPAMAAGVPAVFSTASQLAPIQSSSSPQTSPRGRLGRPPARSEQPRRAASEETARPPLSRRSARLGRLSACFCAPEQ